MPSLLLTDRAIADLDRLADFLADGDPREADATSALVAGGLAVLEAHPLMGWALADGSRELVISRGRSGYVATYRFHAPFDRVDILAIRHQREAGSAEE